jgi:hypothetical protein
MVKTPGARLDPDQLRAALRRWADGYLPSMAAVELLIAHGHWLRREPFLRHVALGGDDEHLLAQPDWAALHQLLAVGGSGGGLFDTSSERGVLAVACSIGAGTPVDLLDVLLSCDQTNVRLVADAVLTAGGAR